MIEIKLRFSELAYKEFRSGLIVKAMSGAFYGLCDEVGKKITDAIDSQEAEVEIVLRSEREGK